MRGKTVQYQRLFLLQFHLIAPGIQGWTEPLHACVGLTLDLQTETVMQKQVRLNANNNIQEKDGWHYWLWSTWWMNSFVNIVSLVFLPLTSTLSFMKVLSHPGNFSSRRIKSNLRLSAVASDWTLLEFKNDIIHYKTINNKAGTNYY